MSIVLKPVLSFGVVAMWYVIDLFLDRDDPMNCILGSEDGVHLMFDTKEEALASEVFAECQDGAVFEPLLHCS